MQEMFLNVTTPDDLHVNLKDVVYIVGILVTLLTAWFKLKHDNDRQTEKIKELSIRADRYYNECKEEFMNAKNGRVSIRRDVDDKVKAVQSEVTKNRETFSTEITNIHTSLTAVKTDTAEIKGMISTLLNKK